MLNEKIKPPKHPNEPLPIPLNFDLKGALDRALSGLRFIRSISNQDATRIAANTTIRDIEKMARDAN